MKAKYIGKYRYKEFNLDFIYLEYEYRGKRYQVYENLNKGNEPLAWQHKSAQASIDAQLEAKEAKQHQQPFNINEIFQTLGWD